MNPAIILFAHGARDPAWAQPIQAIRQTILTQAPNAQVELAFLELMEPTLLQAVARLHTQGNREIVIIPIFMAQSGHSKRDLPDLLAAAMATYPDVRLRLAPPIGEAATVVAAIASYALQA